MVKEPEINEEVLDEEEDDLITLLDDDGNELKFFHSATVDYKGGWYIFLQPAEDMEDIEDDEVVIFKLEKDENGDDLFQPIEDEKLLDEVYAEYEKLVEESIGEEGCECDDEECECCSHHEGKQVCIDDDCDCKK